MGVTLIRFPFHFSHGFLMDFRGKRVYSYTSQGQSV